MLKKSPIESTRRNEFPREYLVWRTMRARCHNPNATGYKWYGGRGIAVHDEWRVSFDKFIEHIGPAPGDHYSVDRIDNMKGYVPGNVRWATWDEQCRNRRPVRNRARYKPENRRDLQLLELRDFLNGD